MRDLFIVIYIIQIIFLCIAVTLFVVDCILEKEFFGLAPFLPIMWGFIPFLGYAIAFAWCADSINNIVKYKKEN